jgi:hypothetical protein
MDVERPHHVTSDVPKTRLQGQEVTQVLAIGSYSYTHPFLCPANVEAFSNADMAGSYL